MIGYLIGLLFFWVTRLADRELCLDDTGSQELLHGLVASLLL
jgi:hypothetical protein